LKKRPSRPREDLKRTIWQMERGPLRKKKGLHRDWHYQIGGGQHTLVWRKGPKNGASFLKGGHLREHRRDIRIKKEAALPQTGI